ncbi:hypothetical protein GCM10009128_26220 [Psychrosphaera haliotis]|uniref:hypothetical protein n=1 Tax=Psychrosphaera haliotis TaxID=555083 RepID=UPI0031D02A6D
MIIGYLWLIWLFVITCLVQSWFVAVGEFFDGILSFFWMDSLGFSVYRFFSELPTESPMLTATFFTAATLACMSEQTLAELEAQC